MRMPPPFRNPGPISTLIVSDPSQDFHFDYDKHLHLNEHDRKIAYSDYLSSIPPLSHVFFLRPTEALGSFREGDLPRMGKYGERQQTIVSGCRD